MSYGQAELNALLEDASITALITQGANGIFYDTVIPDKYPTSGAETGNEDATINYYRIDPVNGGLDYMQTSYSVNSRAPSQKEAEAIAQAVKDVVNRHSSSEVFFVVAVLAVIPPSDATDNYNAPVEVIAKGRSF